MSITGIESTGTMTTQELQKMMQGLQGLQNAGSQGMASEMEGLDSSMKDKLMQEFDADGDGELSEEETAALQEKLEGMLNFMGQLAQAMQSGGGGSRGGAEGGADDAEDTDFVAAFTEAVSNASSDAADADGDGVVTDQELADYLGVQLQDLSSALKGGARQGGQSGPPDELGQDSGFGREAMLKAIDSYIMNVENGLTEGALSSGDGINAVA